MLHPPVAGLVLAAGAGRRMGGPKALLRLSPHGPTLVERTVAGLRKAGLAEVLVVVGASAERVATHVTHAGGRAVEADDWDVGMGASLRHGLDALADTPARAALLTLVDLPDVRAQVHQRLLASTDEGDLDTALVRAAYDGQAGHPVLIGRDHWDAIAREAVGDRGARTYFATHRPLLIECGDLATGRDVDRPADV